MSPRRDSRSKPVGPKPRATGGSVYESGGAGTAIAQIDAALRSISSSPHLDRIDRIRLASIRDELEARKAFALSVNDPVLIAECLSGNWMGPAIEILISDANNIIEQARKAAA